MKRLLLYLFTAAGLLLNAISVPAQVVVTPSVVREVDNTFTDLFNALKDGDVNRIESYLSAEEYADYKVLFEQNTDYPEFLRSYYQGATVRIVRVDSVLSSDDEVIGEFKIDLPGGEAMTTRMRMKKNRGGGWNIKKVLAGQHDQGEPSGKGRR
jgi:ABC-type transporter MlaC component